MNLRFTMSQRRKSQKSQSSQSRPRPSTSSQMTNGFIDDDEHESGSQSSPNKTMSIHDHELMVARAVKYILAADHSKVPILRTAISKAIECQGKNLTIVMNSAKKVLDDVFGFKMVDLDGKVILCNNLENDRMHLAFDQDISNRYVLLFFTLTHIYMNGEKCTEGSLINFLTKLGILVDNNPKHEVFGDVIEIIMQDFCKEKYLETEKSENNGITEVELKWGPRAEQEVSIRSIMEFVTTVYGDREMETWPQAYDTMIRREGHQNDDRE